MTTHTPDDGFHEIQLNGKQLVFLFMAATVVSVLIFLFGVLVGRGVRAERTAVADSAAMPGPVADAAPASAQSSPASLESDPRVAVPPPPAADELSYFNRLEKPQPPVEDLKPAPAVARPRPEPKPAPSAAAAAPAAVTASSEAKPVPAGKPGFAVQLAALNSRSEADAMVKRLSARGYEAYVLSPSGGAPAIYRVRIGNFDSRRDAESMATRLEKEGQFKPWVTR